MAGRKDIPVGTVGRIVTSEQAGWYVTVEAQDEGFRVLASRHPLEQAAPVPGKDFLTFSAPRKEDLRDLFLARQWLIRWNI